MLSFRRKNLPKSWILLIITTVIFAGTGEVRGQKFFATLVSKSGTGITNEDKAKAIDASVQPILSTPYANINVSGTGSTFGGSANSSMITLSFPSIPANKFVYVRIANQTTTGTGGSFKAEAYNNTSNVTGISKLTVGADGFLYYAVNSTGTFNGVRITATGNGGLLGSTGTANIDILYAFYSTDDCGSSLGTDGTNVSNPERAIDDNKTTFSTLTPGALLSSAQQNFYFPGPANSSDEVKLTISAPAATLSVALLNNISISAYNGSSTTAVWTAQLGNILSADLLGLLSNANPITFSVAPGAAFDRVTINFGSVLNLFSNLYVHEIQRTSKKPVFTLPSQQNQTSCPGSTVTFTPDAPASGNTYKWYNLAENGTLLSTGNSYSVTPVANTTYYVATSKTSCSGESVRVPVTATINTISGGTIATGQTLCSGSIPATFNSTTAATIMTGGTAATYQWQKSSDNITFTNITNATGLAYTETLALTATTYYRRVASSAFNGVVCTALTNNVTVTINPKPSPPHATIITNSQY